MNNKIQFKVLLWRNLLYKKRHKVSSLIEIIVPVVILLIICYVASNKGVVIQIQEVDAPVTINNDYRKLFTNENFLGFVFPDNFQNKEKFIENLKNDIAFKNHSIHDTYDNKKIRKRSLEEVENDNNNNKGLHSIIQNEESFGAKLNDYLHSLPFWNNYSIFNNTIINSNNKNISKTLKQRDYYDHASSYTTKYTSYNLRDYNYNPHYDTYDNSEKVDFYFLIFDNEEELQKFKRFDLFGIVFKSQTEYTIRTSENNDISQYLYRVYSSKYMPYERLAEEIRALSCIQNAIDQALIKTLVDNNEYDVNIYEKIMDQKSEYFDYNSNPASSYLPYLILFFFVPCITNLFLYLVIEKETKFKYTLTIMGLKKNMFWISWGLIYTCIIGIASLLSSILIASNKIYPFSVVLVCFILIIFYGLSNCFTVFGFSTFIMKSRTSLVNGVIFISIKFVFFFIHNCIKGNNALLIILGFFFSPISLLSSFNRINELQSNIVNFNLVDVLKDGKMYGHVLGLFFSCVLYLLVAIYLDNILPQGTAMNKKWNYLFKSSKSNENEFQPQVDSNNTTENSRKKYIESDPNSIEKVLEVNSLYKYFYTGKNKLCVLNNISFNVYANEIFAIIGHNGAGKSTLLNILTGLYPESSGKILYDSVDFKENKEKLIPDIGYCPQYNVFSDFLTIVEHLKLFCGMRNVDEDYDYILKDIGLLEYKNRYPSVLSAGQRRLLNIAFAFIGKPRYVFLDEPTTGLDALSKKKVWKYLSNKKQKCTIFMTTHYMDEADLLADRKMIISNGSICCIGSSLFLKRVFNMNYSFDIVIDKEKNEEVKSILERYIKNIEVTEGYTTNNEKMFSYKFPISYSEIFHVMISEINKLVENYDKCKGYSVTAPTLEELFIKLETGKAESSNISISNNGITEKMKKKYSEENKESLSNFQQIWSLVKVRIKLFLRNKVAAINTVVFPTVITVVCLLLGNFIKNQYNTPRVEAFKNIDISTNLYKNVNWFKGSQSDNNGLSVFDKMNIDKSSINKVINYNNELSLASGHSDEKDDYIGGFEGYVNNDDFNIIIYHNDDYVLALPIAINLINNAILSSYNKDLEIITHFHYFENVYNTDNTDNIDNNEKEDDASTFHFNFIIEYLVVGVMGVMFSLLVSLYGPSIINEKEKNITQQLFLNGMKNINYWLGVLISDFICIFMSIIFFTIIGVISDMSIFYYKGIPFTIFILMLWSIACLLFQYIINFNFKSYEKSSMFSLIFNPVSTLILSIISVIGILKELNDNSGGIHLSQVLYFIIPMTFFAPSGITILLFKTVLVTTLKMYDDKYNSFINSKEYEKLYQHKNDDDYNDQFNRVYKRYCYPNFFEFFSAYYKIFYIIIILVFTIILYALILYQLEKNKNSKKKAIRKWNDEDRIKQNNILNSGPEDVLHEWRRVQKSIDDPNSEEGKTISLKVHEIRKDYRFEDNRKKEKENKNKKKTNRQSRHFSTNSYIDNENNANEDASRGDERIFINPKTNNQYKRVIDDLTFGVNYGECLGLLGPNGAGKTTTVSIISYIKSPTLGEVIYGNDNLSNKNLYDLGIGICPQFNSLWESLTVKEHIEFYYDMNGYSKEEIKEIITSLVDFCGIESHINKRVSDVSSGTRRKLSLIISLCSSPKYLLLDEPTAGIDPFTRRYIWNLIKEFKQINQTATILTTHSTEEAEYLCDRIAILMKGKLACIDSPKNIKLKYSNYYILEVHTEDPCYFENKIVLEENLFGLNDYKSYTLKSYIKFQKYTVKIEQKQLAYIFYKLEKCKKNKIIKEYNFGQCSLEQAYINIVKGKRKDSK